MGKIKACKTYPVTVLNIVGALFRCIESEKHGFVGTHGTTVKEAISQVCLNLGLQRPGEPSGRSALPVKALQSLCLILGATSGETRKA